MLKLLSNHQVTSDRLRELHPQATRENLLAVIVHEINNPLAAIVAHLDLLRTDRIDDPVVTRHLNVVIPQLERVSAILDRARGFVRSSSGRVTRLDIGESLRTVAALLEYHYRTSDVAIELEIPRGLPPFMGAPGRLQQAWLNYLNNAFEALCRKEPRGGRIRIKARHNKKLREVTVEIADTGVGMDRETLASLRRSSSGRSDAGGAAGIGTRESARIIAEHGGSVDVTSTPGKGTTVRVTLPLHQTRKT
jgi:signal transduction histidine kinase